MKNLLICSALFWTIINGNIINTDNILCIESTEPTYSHKTNLKTFIRFSGFGIEVGNITPTECWNKLVKNKL